MSELPFSRIFPHIHPLDSTVDAEKETEGLNLGWQFITPLKNQYEYVLPQGYLTAEKLNKALTYLDDNFTGDTLLEKYEQFSRTDSRPYGDRPRDLDCEGISFFWVYITGAFLNLNAFIATHDREHLYIAETAFAHADTLKELWIERTGRRKGMAKTQQKKQDKKDFVFSLWAAHAQKWSKLDDVQQYKELKNVYIQNGGNRKFGKFYAESSFTRGNASNLFTQFANKHKSA